MATQSNGPYEYISVLDEFFGIANLPPGGFIHGTPSPPSDTGLAGSIKLRSYAGKSFLSGLLSAPAARKRAGVTEVLESFPDSKFLLIGDSGEQDMELYAE
jgi:phosphatidate phosphatase APP1